MGQRILKELVIIGFHAPCGHEAAYYDIAFGKYEFTFDLPDSSYDKSFTLDLRDADWSGNYSIPFNITIRWDIINSQLKYTISGPGNPYHLLDKDTIWNILNEAPPNQIVFQPTQPSNLFCYNFDQTEECPIF